MQALASVKQSYNKGLHAVLYMLGQRTKQPSDAWHGFGVLDEVQCFDFCSTGKQ